MLVLLVWARRDRPPGFLASERSHAIHVTVPPGASLREPISHFNVEATPVPACSRSWNANLAVNMANNKRQRGDRCLYFIFFSLLLFTVMWYLEFGFVELSNCFQSFNGEWWDYFYFWKNCINIVILIENK